ncbi:MAG TPA: HAD hydrolase-like protein [Gaiellaceae bacterium]
MIETVVFDLDGILVDSEQVWDQVREQLVLERGGRWHDRAQRDMMGMSSDEWSRYMHEELGLKEPPEEISAEVVRRLMAIYRERCRCSQARARRSSAWQHAGRSGSLPPPTDR